MLVSYILFALDSEYHGGLGLVHIRHQHFVDGRHFVQTHVRQSIVFYVRIPNFVILVGPLAHDAICVTTAS